MGKTTRENAQPHSQPIVARLALLEPICQASGTTVRHIIRLRGDLSARDLTREVEEYREVGWRVSMLWRGSCAVMVSLSNARWSTSTSHNSLAVLAFHSLRMMDMLNSTCDPSEVEEVE